MTHMFETIAIHRADGECQPPLRDEGHRRLRRPGPRCQHAAAPGHVGLEHRRRQDAGRHGQRSARLHRHRPIRSGDHRHQPLGDGHRRADQPADGGGRRVGSRLVARSRRPGARRREEIRQPGHRRIAQRPPLRAADAAVRRGDAHDAGAGGRHALGRRGLPRCGRRTTRSCISPSGNMLGYGELAKAASALPTPAGRQPQAEGSA